MCLSFCLRKQKKVTSWQGNIWSYHGWKRQGKIGEKRPNTFSGEIGKSQKAVFSLQSANWSLVSSSSDQRKEEFFKKKKMIAYAKVSLSCWHYLSLQLQKIAWRHWWTRVWTHVDWAVCHRHQPLAFLASSTHVVQPPESSVTMHGSCGILGQFALCQNSKMPIIAGSRHEPSIPHDLQDSNSDWPLLVSCLIVSQCRLGTPHGSFALHAV